jgi:hypothetical protein
MRLLLVIATTLLISQYGRAQQGGGTPPAGGAQPGGRGGGGSRGGGGGGGARGGGGRGAAAEPPPAANPGFECFQSVETPEFPASALRAHVDGTVYASIQVTPQGAVDKIDTQVASAWGDGPKLLTPAVEKAVRASKFKPECSGKTVAVVYRYALHGDSIASAKPTTKMELSNIMDIESQPQSAAAAKSGPAAK